VHTPCNLTAKSANIRLRPKPSAVSHLDYILSSHQVANRHLIERASAKVKEAAGISTQKADASAQRAAGNAKGTAHEMAGKAKGTAQEMAGEAKGTAQEMAGEAKGKTSELVDEAKGKKEEVKSKI